jgi:hypothetical protein
MFGVILRKRVLGPTPRQVEGGCVPGDILIDVSSDYGVNTTGKSPNNVSNLSSSEPKYSLACRRQIPETHGKQFV